MILSRSPCFSVSLTSALYSFSLCFSALFPPVSLFLLFFASFSFTLPLSFFSPLYLNSPRIPLFSLFPLFCTAVYYICKKWRPPLILSSPLYVLGKQPQPLDDDEAPLCVFFHSWHSAVQRFPLWNPDWQLRTWHEEVCCPAHARLQGIQGREISKTSRKWLQRGGTILKKANAVP